MFKPKLNKLTQKNINNKIIILFVMLCLVLPIFSMMNTNAATIDYNKGKPKGDCVLCGGKHDFNKIGFSGRTIYSMACMANGDIMSNSDPYSIDNTSGTNSISDILRFDTSETIVSTNPDGTVNTTTGGWRSILELAKSTYNTMSVLGMLIIFIYFVLELGEAYIYSDGITPDSFFKLCFKTFVGCAIVLNGADIIEWMLTLSTSLYDTLNQTMVASGSTPAYSVASCPGTLATGGDSIKNFLELAGHALALIFPFAIMLFIYISLRVAVYARVLDITVRIIFAPIGMADIYKGDMMRSQGMKYFKKMFASMFSGTVTFGTILAYQVLASSIKSSFAGYTGCILLGLACITAIKKTTDLAKEIVGI